MPGTSPLVQNNHVGGRANPGCSQDGGQDNSNSEPQVGQRAARGQGLRRAFDDLVELDLHATDQAALEAAYRESVQAGNRLKGATGEQYAINWLRDRGYNIIAGATSVTDVNGELRIYDALGRAPGEKKLTAFEFKTGPTAERTGRQVRIDQSVMARGASIINPITAFNAGVAGRQPMDVMVINVILLPTP